MVHGVVDPDKGGQHLCDHASVSGAVFPKDEVGATETQLRNSHQLPGAGVWIQTVGILNICLYLFIVSLFISINIKL